jgi:DNA polymerase-3 subunit alpha
MLAVLEQAQGAGQKAQQDALIGQGSIFDLDPTPAVGNGAAAGHAGGALPGASLMRPSHPIIPHEEFDQAELLAVEKEAIGLFISAHPLKPLREAMRARVDCPLAALADRRDKDWVTVGGIITEAKRIRTRNGDHMMFATLDDLEGAVEILVFGKAMAEHEAALAIDQVVLVRGRVDHKEAGKTCVVVQSVETFAPTAQELEQADASARAHAAKQSEGTQPMHLRVDLASLAESAIEDFKHLAESFPGSVEVVLELIGDAGQRWLRLGEAYRVSPVPALHAELAQIFPQASTPAAPAAALAAA